MNQVRIFPPLGCCACNRLIQHPRWARVEHLRYHAFCAICYQALDALLTPYAAIYEARRIVRSVEGAVAR
jgi:hypothetical protein